ncbi:MAG: chemotaxis protein CheW [Nitrospirota bacterium]
MERSYITFMLSGQIFGIDIDRAGEIAPIPEITPVGKMPPFVAGFINLRGKLILVIDTREALDLEPAPTSLNNNIISVDINGSTIGLIVDSMRDIVTVDDSQITGPPEEWEKIDIRYIAAVVRREKDLVTILDVEKIFSDKEKEIIKTSAKKLGRKKKTAPSHPEGEKEILRKRAELLSEKAAEPEAETGKGMSVVIFRMGDEDYAMDLRHVLLTEKLRYIARIPSTPDFIAGVMNLSGSILPVIDMRVLMGYKGEAKEEVPLLIVSLGGDRAALLVDEIKDIAFIPLKDIKPPLGSIAEDKKLYIQGEVIHNERIVVILKTEMLLAPERLGVSV